MQLGEKIKALRKERGLTQASLAGEYITRNMLCEIEKGKAMPSIDTLLRIAEGLDVPPRLFAGRKRNPCGLCQARGNAHHPPPVP